MKRRRRVNTWELTARVRYELRKDERHRQMKTHAFKVLVRDGHVKVWGRPHTIARINAAFDALKKRFPEYASEDQMSMLSWREVVAGVSGGIPERSAKP